MNFCQKTADNRGVIDPDLSVAEGCDEGVGQFLTDLSADGIRLSVHDTKLRCTGPADLLQGEVGRKIRVRKTEIIAYLSAQDSRSAPIPECNLGVVPLSPAQSRLWLVEQIDPKAAHHIPFTIEAEGTLDVRALEIALRRIMQRHAVLRLRIVTENGEIRQRFDVDAKPTIRRIDMQGISPTEIAKICAEEVATPFDLTREPPVRLAILQCAPDRHILIFTLHHIAADGSSIEILMREFAAFYRDAVTGLHTQLSDLPVQYGDYAAWLNEEAGTGNTKAGMRFWQSRLGQDLPVTRLPADFPRPSSQNLTGASLPITIPADLTERLRMLGATRNASLFAVLLTAFKVVIHRYTGQRDLIVGIPSANRNRPETEAMVGLFVNPLPIRSQIDPLLGFASALEIIQKNTLEAIDHQCVSFEQLVAAFQTRRDPGASPLFQLKFQLDRAPRETFSLPDLTLRRLPRQGNMALHDLSLDLVEGDHGIDGSVVFATSLFRPDTVAAFSRHYLKLLYAIAQDPDKPVALLDILTSDERQNQLAAWNDNVRPLDPGLRFPALFEAHAKATPDAVAVEYVTTDHVHSLTYAQLNARANQLAHALQHAGAGPDKIIGISLERGPDMVAAWLAVLKSGAAYLPLDPAYPADRLNYMLGDAGVELVLTHEHIPLPDGVKRWNLNQRWPEGPQTNPKPGRDPEDLAYVIYTSGSTGRPKGVEVPHAGLVNLTLDKLSVCGPGPGDRIIGFFSFSFDASIPDLVMAFGSGARLVLAPAEDLLPGPPLSRLLRDRKMTHLTITPSALACLPKEEYPDLRMILVGGEAPAPELVRHWSDGRLFINAYGPTECTVNASMVPCGNGHPVEPTLTASANKQLHVLDDMMELLPVGCPGELYIGGTGLARGYRGRPDLTAAAFLPNPYGQPGERLYRSGDRAVRLPDGRIKLLGRMDDQIKIRGFRIEPEEIARACRTHAAIEAAVVAPRDVPGIGVRLVAWLVARDRALPDTELRAHLLTALPRQMIPDDLIWMDRLPLTVNGKLDLRALPDPRVRHGKGRPPQGATETALAGIFADLLKISEPSAEDDFFDLGGNSLLATRLVTALAERFSVTIRVLELFDASTIDALAQLIDAGTSSATEDWRDDLILDDSIHPGRPVRTGLGDCVFMTGCTGFIGAHVLAELLGRPERRVLCLMRKDDICALHQVFGKYGLDTASLSRVTTIRGDLSAANLGLSAPNRDLIHMQATSVLHCGAIVHHLTPYRKLRAANVLGTQEVLRLAADAGIALHHISTLSALAPGDTVLSEADAAETLEPPAGGYNLSKWVAEHLVAEAGRRGLPITIHRLGSVSASSQTGAFNSSDILARQVQGYLAAGVAPKGRALLNMIPVDYAAKAICALAGRDDHSMPVFHMTHSRPVSSDLLFAACVAEGHALRRLPGKEWQDLLNSIAESQPDHPLFPLIALGGAQGFTGAQWPYGCKATRAALHAELPEPDLDEAFLRHYIRALSSRQTRPIPSQEALT